MRKILENVRTVHKHSLVPLCVLPLFSLLCGDCCQALLEEGQKSQTSPFESSEGTPVYPEALLRIPTMLLSSEACH